MLNISAKYPDDPVASISSLARKLNVEEGLLLSVASDTGKYWRPGRTKIVDGKPPRYTNDARAPLKLIHERIKARFLDSVDFPYYILGGIASDAQTYRSYHAHAEAHTYKNMLLNEDIASFYPNTTKEIVKDVWQRFFKFHPDVAEILACLTTHKEVLPQGWITSTHLANLVLWRHEPGTVERLEKLGFVYTRFIDDVTISSSDFVSPKLKTLAVTEVIGMMQRSGYKPKRAKHELATAGQRMRVVNLNVNKGYASIPKSERRRTRSMVHKCVLYDATARNCSEYISLWDKASGRVASLKRLHPDEEKKLRTQLNLIRPQRPKKRNKQKRKTAQLPKYNSTT